MKKSISYEVKLSSIILLISILLLIATVSDTGYIAGLSFLGGFFLTATVLPAVGLELI